MKPMNASSIEAALQAAVIEVSKQHGRAAKAKGPSFRIVDAGTRPPWESAALLSGGTHCLGDLFNDIGRY